MWLDRWKMMWRVKVQRAVPDFLWPHPFEWLISIMCLLTALPNLAGKAPNAIEQSLPPIARLLWSLSLLLGGGALFIGITWRSFELQRQGFGLLSLAAFVYTAVIIVRVGTSVSPFGIGILLVFAFCCAIRRFELTTIKKLAIKRVEARERDE